MKKWIYVGHVRAHTHDIRALTVAVPICREGIFLSYCSLLVSFLSIPKLGNCYQIHLGRTLDLLVKPKFIIKIELLFIFGFGFVQSLLFSYFLRLRLFPPLLYSRAVSR